MDLNSDGKDDIVSGSYDGKITVYYGTDSGYNAPQSVEQVTDITDVKLYENYAFTNPTFGDFNGDGLLDAFLGGFHGVQVMLNIGTKEKPILGERTPILCVDGNQVSAFKCNESTKGKQAKDFKSFVYFIDWDGDGVKDIITSNSYSYEGQSSLLFHKGVNTSNGMRFEKGVSIFKEENGCKIFPGHNLIPYFCDYNGDGRMDILLGVTIYYDIMNQCFNNDNEYRFIIGENYFKVETEIREASTKYADDDEYEQAINEIKAKYNVTEKLIKSQVKKPRYGAKGYILLFLGQ